jgi:hypothetical protein
VIKSNILSTQVIITAYILILQAPGTSVSSNNKTDSNNITEILLKVALNTITLLPVAFI